MGKRLPALDGLRGLAALWVLICHYHTLHPIITPWPRGSAHLGVMIFFVLSGFLMAHLTLKEGPTAPSTTRFYVHRFARVVPLWIVLLVLSKVLVEVAPSWHWHLFFDKDDTIMENLLLQDGSRIMWSIVAEIKFYIVWPILWLVMTGLDKAGKWLPIALIACMLLNPAANHDGGLEQRVFVDVGMFFLAGVAVRAWNIDVKSWVWDAVGAAALAGLYFSVEANQGKPMDMQYAMPHYVLCSAMVLLSALNGKLVPKVLSVKPLMWLGTVSYSLYLLHLPTMWYVRRLTPIEDYLPDPVMFAFCTAIALAVSYASFLVIERPARNFINRGYARLTDTKARQVRKAPTPLEQQQPAE